MLISFSVNEETKRNPSSSGRDLLLSVEKSYHELELLGDQSHPKPIFLVKNNYTLLQNKRERWFKAPQMTV